MDLFVTVGSHLLPPAPLTKRTATTSLFSLFPVSPPRPPVVQLLSFSFAFRAGVLGFFLLFFPSRIPPASHRPEPAPPFPSPFSANPLAYHKSYAFSIHSVRLLPGILSSHYKTTRKKRPAPSFPVFRLGRASVFLGARSLALLFSSILFVPFALSLLHTRTHAPYTRRPRG